jgi:hypothetical protein
MDGVLHGCARLLKIKEGCQGVFEKFFTLIKINQGGGEKANRDGLELSGPVSPDASG